VLLDELETIAAGLIDDWGTGERGSMVRTPNRKEKRDSSLRFAPFGMTATGKKKKRKERKKKEQRREACPPQAATKKARWPPEDGRYEGKKRRAAA
jgi:hypothetical protein